MAGNSSSSDHCRTRFPLAVPCPAPEETGLLYIVIDDGERREVWVNPAAPRLIDAHEVFQRD